MINVLKLILPYIRPYLKYAILCALLAIPMACIKAFQAYFIKDVIDGIFDPTATFEYAVGLAGVLVGIAVINYPIRYIHYFGIRMVVDKATCGIRHDIYKKFQNLNSKFFANSKQGELLSVMINDTNIFAEAFNHAISIFREPLTAILLLSVAIWHDWKLALIIFTVIPFFIIIFNITGKKIRKYVSKAQEDNAHMTHHGTEGLTGQKIIRAFNLQNYMIKRFDNAQTNYINNKRKSNSAEEHSHPSVELIAACAFGVVVVAAYMRAQDQALTVGEFMSFVASLAMFMDPIRRYSKANTKLNQARAASSRIFRLLDSPEETNNGQVEFKSFESEIEFKNITFAYDTNPVLRNFSLIIEKGKKTALVGLSGSGKSTLVSLLLRLYDVEQGEILIDGKNIKDYTLTSLRNQFALVSQDIFLFNDTIRENICAGDNYTEKQIEEALNVSYASEFINTLPEKLDTTIGDRGMRLSGGQSQRITIARAFLKDCPVLLFDEATSALDNESERIVQKALDEVSGHKTVVAIAHRLSTIQSFDKIVVMKEGQIIEQGSHEQLMSNKNEYEKLYNLSL